MARSAVPEKRFQSQVIDPARLSGWRTYHAFDSRRSAAGFPGPVMVMPVVIFAGRKTEGGRVRPEQRGWLEVPERCLGVVVRLWRPRDWPEIEETLTRPADTMSRRAFGPPDVPSDLLCPGGASPGRGPTRPRVLPWVVGLSHGWSVVRDRRSRRRREPGLPRPRGDLVRVVRYRAAVGWAGRRWTPAYATVCRSGGRQASSEGDWGKSRRLQDGDHARRCRIFNRRGIVMEEEHG